MTSNILKDVKVYRIGKQLLINIPKEIADELKLGPGPVKIIHSSRDQLIIEKGGGPAKILEVGPGKLRLYISIEQAPFKEGDRVVVTVKDGKLMVKRIDYYIAKPSIKQGYYRVNIPWKLVEETGLDKYPLVKIYSDGKRVVLEPLREI